MVFYFVFDTYLPHFYSITSRIGEINRENKKIRYSHLHENQVSSI